MEWLRALEPTKIFLDLLYPTFFSLRVDFHCRVIFTCVKFTFASKIEAMHERSHVNEKVEPRATSRISSSLYILPRFYLRNKNFRACART